MLNQAKPASVSGSNNGRTLVLLLTSSNPPPWIRMAAGNGPGPSGTCRSRSNGMLSGRPYSTSFLSKGAAASEAAQATARTKVVVRMEGLYQWRTARRRAAIRQHQQWSGHAGKVVMHGAMRGECTQRAHDVARLPGAGNSSSLDGDGDTALRIHATHGELQRNRRPHGRIFGN